MIHSMPMNLVSKFSKIAAMPIIRAQRPLTAHGEVRLYGHSSQRESKERGLAELFAKRLEEALEQLAAGLHTPAHGEAHGEEIRQEDGAHRAAQTTLRARRPVRRHRGEPRPSQWSWPVAMLPLSSGRASSPSNSLCRGCVLPAHQPDRVGRSHTVAHLHEADRPRSGVSLTEIGTGAAPGLSA